MVFSRKWVLYNTFTGAVIKDLPLVDDQCYRDINNGDEATINIPAYALSDEDRLNAPQVFRSWGRGIALIDNARPWNNQNKVLFAGPIIKGGYSTKEEEINLTAYSFFEHLKKVMVIPIWNTQTDKKAFETIEAGTWGGVYTKLIKRGVSTAGAPAGWNPIGINQMRNFPDDGGFGKKVDILVSNQNMVAGVMENVRDTVSDSGNEFFFNPVFTDSGMGTIKFDMIVGSDTSPHINEGNVLEVPLSETSENVWRVAEWSLTFDSTTLYNKILIDGGSEEKDTYRLKPAFDFSNTAYPSMTEVFKPGVILDDPTLQKQLDARIKNTLVPDKTPTLEITKDENFEFIAHLGKTLNVTPGLKSAGWGTKVRLVGVRFSSKDAEMNVSIDSMRLADRYPRLPIEDMKQTEDYGNGSFGGGIGDFNTGGELPNYEDLQEDKSTSAFMAINKRLPATATNGSTTEPGRWDTHTSNITADGKYFYGIRSPKMDFVYDSSSQLKRTFSNLIISQNKITVDNFYLNPTVSNLEGTSYDLSAFANANFPDVPLSLVPTGDGNNVDANNNNSTLRWAYIWTVKGKVYVMLTLGVMYVKRNTQNEIGGRRFFQKIYALDINQATGTLSNPQVIDVKFANAATNFPQIVTAPFLGVTSNDSYGQRSNFIGSPPIVIDDNKVIFQDCVGLTNLTPYSTSSVTGMIFDARLYGNTPNLTINGEVYPVIEGDFSSPTLPSFKLSDTVPHILGKATGFDTSMKMMTDNGIKDVDTTNKNQNGVTSTSGYMPNLFFQSIVHDAVNRELYCFPHPGTDNQIDLFFFTEEPDGWKSSITTFRGESLDNTFAPVNTKERKKTNGQIFKMKYGLGETSWTKLGGKYLSKLFDRDGIETYAGVPAEGGLFIPQPYQANNYERVGYGLFVSEKGTKQIVGSGNLNLDAANYTVANGNLSRNYFPIQVTYRHRVPQQVGSNALWIANTTYPVNADTQSAGIDGNAGYRLQLTIQKGPFNKKVLNASGNVIISDDGELFQFKRNYTVGTYENGGFAQKFTDAVWITADADESNTLAIDSKQILWGWGISNNVIGTPNNPTPQIPKQVSAQKFRQVRLNMGSSVAIDDNGELWTWGSNGQGRTGHGPTSGITPVPTKVQSLNGVKFIKIAIGRTSIWALDDTRKLWFAGTMNGIAANVTTFRKINEELWYDFDVIENSILGVEFSRRDLWSGGDNYKVDGSSPIGVVADGAQPFAMRRNDIDFANVVLIKDQSSNNAIAGFALSEEKKLYASGARMYAHPTNRFNQFTDVTSLTYHRIKNIWAIRYSLLIQYDEFSASTSLGAMDNMQPTYVPNNAGSEVVDFWVPVFGVYPIVSGLDGLDLPPGFGDGMIGN